MSSHAITTYRERYEQIILHNGYRPDQDTGFEYHYDQNNDIIQDDLARGWSLYRFCGLLSIPGAHPRQRLAIGISRDSGRTKQQLLSVGVDIDTWFTHLFDSRAFACEYGYLRNDRSSLALPDLVSELGSNHPPDYHNSGNDAWANAGAVLEMLHRHYQSFPWCTRSLDCEGLLIFFESECVSGNIGGHYYNHLTGFGLVTLSFADLRSLAADQTPMAAAKVHHAIVEENIDKINRWEGRGLEAEQFDGMHFELGVGPRGGRRVTRQIRNRQYYMSPDTVVVPYSQMGKWITQTLHHDMWASGPSTLTESPAVMQPRAPFQPSDPDHRQALRTSSMPPSLSPSHSRHRRDYSMHHLSTDVEQPSFTYPSLPCANKQQKDDRIDAAMTQGNARSEEPTPRTIAEPEKQTATIRSQQRMKRPMNDFANATELQSNCKHNAFGSPFKENHPKLTACPWRGFCQAGRKVATLLRCKGCNLAMCQQCWNHRFPRHSNRTGRAANDDKRRYGRDDDQKRYNHQLHREEKKPRTQS